MYYVAHGNSPLISIITYNVRFCQGQFLLFDKMLNAAEKTITTDISTIATAIVVASPPLFIL